jgi:hypothetical protein
VKFNFAVLELYRVQIPPYISEKFGEYGMFEIPSPVGNYMLRVIADNGELDIAKGWEHVSVSLPKCCPNWPEMDYIKDLFWDTTETVIQFHVPKKEHINYHSYCLHLWRNKNKEIELPPVYLV